MNIKTLLFFFLLLSGFSAGLKAQDFADPLTYQNFILTEHTEFILNHVDYMAKILYDHEVRRDQEQLNLLTEQIDKSIGKLEKMPSFNDDISLKEAGLQMLIVYKKTLQNQTKLADSLKIGKKSSFEEMKTYYLLQNELEKELIDAGKKFEKMLKVFARKADLDKSEPVSLFDKVVEVNAYCRRIYLSYYNLSKVNEDFFDALKNRQPESMESHRKNLLEVAEISQKELQSEEKHEGYRNYLHKGLKFVHYIKEQAEKEYPQLVQIAAKKNATFDDANKFNIIVINYYKKAKHIIEDFNQASVHLMEKSVIQESGHALLNGAHKPQSSILSKVDKQEFAPKTSTPNPGRTQE
ncbi:MAG: hypothetical protein NW226_23870 [Microscillaceae bacterium]|nr:hypothetical protein [Microscillaceae bacterium]